MHGLIMFWRVYASTLSTRPFTLSLRQPSAVQPEGRRETFVEFEGEGAASKDEGSAMLMLCIFGRGECPIIALSPAQAMVQIDAARLLP